MVQEKMQEYSKIAAFLTNQLTFFFASVWHLTICKTAFSQMLKLKSIKKGHKRGRH